MKKTDWPIRWDLLLRYRLIEIIALWEGRLTTNHICHSFGIGRQQASKDINTYLRELAPDNLVYDRHLKGYVPSSSFRPVVTAGNASEYQDLLARQDALSDTFESLNISLPDSTIVRGPERVVKPEVMRAAVAAARHGRVMKAEYASLSPAGEQGTAGYCCHRLRHGQQPARTHHSRGPCTLRTVPARPGFRQPAPGPNGPAAGTGQRRAAGHCRVGSRTGY